MEAGAELGVVAALAGAVGAVVVAARAPFACALVAASAAGALLLVAAEVTAGGRVEHGGAAWAVLLASAVIPLGAGITHMASKLGPARAASAVVIAVVALVWPVLDGGARRWRRDVQLPERLLEQALSPQAPRAAVDPGTAEMDGLFGYGTALGARPDLVLLPPDP